MAKITFKDPINRKPEPTPVSTGEGNKESVLPKTKQDAYDSLAASVSWEGKKGMIADTAWDIAKVVVILGLLYLLKRKWRPLPKSIARWKPKLVIPDTKARQILKQAGRGAGWIGKLALIFDLFDAGSDLIKVCDKETAISFAENMKIVDVTPWARSAAMETYSIDPDVAKGIALSMMAGATALVDEKQVGRATPLWTEAENLIKEAYAADLAGNNVIISWPAGYEAERQKYLDAWLGWYGDVSDSDLMIDVATLLYNPTRVIHALPKMAEIVKTVIYFF